MTLTRRSFLGSVGAGLIASPLAFAQTADSGQRKRMAVITTEWRVKSHAWHMAERFLVGYPQNGHWHRPPFDVVSAYVDQFPENDLSRLRADEFGFKIYPTIAETIRCGGDKLAVDAVLIIGEHMDLYDFHALEVIQCMAERRKGGETGVSAVQGLKGNVVWKAMAAGSWNAGGWDPNLFQACLSRSQTLAQPKSFSHRYPTDAQIREWVEDPIAYRIEYTDGTKATMLLMNGLVGDFTFAARLKGQTEPLSTLFYLPPNPNVTYSAELMSKAEETFVTGKSPYPIERTLLTTGLVEACIRSVAAGQKRVETPHLAVSYQVPRESTFAQR